MFQYCSLAQPSLAPAAHITKTAHYPPSPRGAAETRSVLQEPCTARIIPTPPTHIPTDEYVQGGWLNVF